MQLIELWNIWFNTPSGGGFEQIDRTNLDEGGGEVITVLF